MLELEHGFRVVDVHARLEPAQGRRRREGLGDPERLEREMHQAGVVRALVAAGPREGSYLKANNAVARLCVERPFVAMARVSGARDPADTPVARLRNLTTSRRDHHTTPADVEQYAYDDRFHGFVLDPAVDGLPDREVRDELIAVDLPVIVYCRPAFPPAAVTDTLLNDGYPVVLAGFGGYPGDKSRMENALALLDQYDHLYLDTWAVRDREILERGLLEHPDRILFGSGTPDVHQNVAVMEILTLDISEDAMSRVFNKNPTRLIPGLSVESEF